MRQLKISKNIGRDTHVRDHVDNIFTTQNNKTTQMLVGEVLFPEPEPLFKQTTVSVKLSRGGTIKHVAYPGAFIDPITGNLHGTYEGPFPGQMVAVGFENGNSANPFVVNRYPYQGSGNTFVESSYTLPMTRAGFHNFDVIIGHFSGSYISFNTGILPSTKLPGSVTVNAMTDFDLSSNTNILLDAIISAEVKAATAKLTGTVSALVGAPDVKLESTLGGIVDVQALIQIKNSAQSMKTLIDSLITVISGAYTIPTVPGNPATLDPAVIALLTAEQAKWALLLSA
jgi:hypothetical protein